MFILQQDFFLDSGLNSVMNNSDQDSANNSTSGYEFSIYQVWRSSSKL